MTASMETVGKLLFDGRKFLTGEKPVIADFILFEHVEYAKHVDPNVTGGNAELIANMHTFHERMANLPGVKEFRESA